LVHWQHWQGGPADKLLLHSVIDRIEQKGSLVSCKTNPSCYSIAGESFDLSNLDDLAAIQTHDFLNI
jgi:hypothetical protein